ncbi:hypothetical protein BUE67_13575, partial [Corynebacterium diphtheriae]
YHSDNYPIIVEHHAFKYLSDYIQDYDKVFLIIERSDSCAVPAASVVCEHVVAFEVAKALLEEFQSNHIDQLKEQIEERRKLNIEF